MRDIKKYDRLLNVKRYLDGTIKIERQSPFSAQKQFEVLEITNKYLGSFNWVLKQIILMDHQRFDITGRAHNINERIRNRKDDNRVSREIADYMYSGGDSIVL